MSRRPNGYSSKSREEKPLHNGVPSGSRPEVAEQKVDPQSVSSGRRGSLPYVVPPLAVDPNAENDPSRNRRFSVSAEDTSKKFTDEDFVKKEYPKNEQAVERIKQSVQDLFLWKGMDRPQQNLLINAMFEKKVRKHEEIIHQGDRGDFFYVVESGKYEVWKSPDIKKHIPAKKVFEYDNHGAFGELALMYNSPRAATVTATTDGILWAVDGQTFRHIIVASTARKRNKYDTFLKDVRLFHNMSDELRSEIADIVETMQFKKGDYVIKQGSEAENFYIIQMGRVNVLQYSQRGSKKETHLGELRSGDFFGERALLLGTQRSASIRVASDNLQCVVMDKVSFLRLCDQLYDKFRSVMANYTLPDEAELDNISDKTDSDDDEY